MSPDRIVLIDSNSLIYRGYFALPALSTTKGEVTHATYGFTSILLKAWQETSPDHIAAAFDLPVPTFRHEKDVRYKATRPRMPEDLRPQIERSKEILDAFGIPIYAAPGFEADDVIGTHARLAEAAGLDTIILSGDLDPLQLVTPHVSLMTTRQGFQNTVIYDEDAIRERFGLRPDQMIDYKCLRGDPSDNIPGVPGVGEKTAAKLIADYGSLEGVYANLEKLTPRLRASLQERRDDVFASRDLVRIVTDVPVTLDLERTRRGPYDRERIIELFRELEFRTLAARLPPLEGPRVTTAHARPLQPQLGLDVAPPDTTELSTGAVASDLDADAIARRVAEAGDVALHAELGPNPRQPELAGLALAVPDASWFLPVEGALPGPVATALADTTGRVVAHDVKTARRALRRGLADVRGPTFDTQIASYLINAGRRTHALEDLAAERLHAQIPALPKATNKKSAPVEPTPAERAAFATASADAVRRLAPLFSRDLDELGLRRLFDEVEMPLIDVLIEMEETGIGIDLPYLATLSTEFAREIARVEREAYDLVGHEFQINSPKQLQDLLFGELKLPRGRRTVSGGYSTDAQVLEELREAHPVVEKILEYREVQKLKSTYADALATLVDPETGRVHTHFNQTIAATGRLSSDSPNLQNIPIRTPLGRRIRRAFVAGERGTVLVAADYSQIELRILAHITDDPGLLEAFRTGDDIHARTAALVLGIPRQQVTTDQRRAAKEVNFGIAYGMSDFGLAWRLRISREEAREFIDNYFKTYPRVRRYVIETKEQAVERGYVETLMGRRRYIADITSPNWTVRGAAERMAINMPIQGTAADIMKIGMIRVRDRLRREGLRTRMVLQVHDELVLEAPTEERDRVVAVAREEMAGAYELAVPMVVDVRVGTNWDDMTRLPEPSPARAS
ncbi:MAG: DNA polymerase I [Chloroflexi bacterium 13_1_40CM_4_68_4]|nr:MAG: DNA polymerase I [Chloroflexi bacterium 13_1_40CM_4_68_4]